MPQQRRKPEELRSHRWFGVNDLRSFGHRSRMLQMGYRHEEFVGRPIVAILNTWSGMNSCHAHFAERVEDVKRGVVQAGGFPVELPSLSLAEPFVKPTTMLYRNLLALETEELLRSHPVDGAVLMGGCDKTTPALLMGAISMDLPAIFLPAGPMLRGNWRGKALGSGSDVWKHWAEKQAGNIAEEEWQAMEAGIARSYGHCMTMGTASTLTAIAETLGFTLPGASSIPAPDAGHARMASATGAMAVEMIWQDRRPSALLTREAFDNALLAQMALGGSTNAIIHLIALARRAGVPLDLADVDRVSRAVPVTANLRPSGAYLMEDFFYAGGLTGCLAGLRERLHLDCGTVNGRTLGENIAGAEIYDSDVIRPLDNPVCREGATAVLFGNIAPNGCVMKPSAAEPRLLRHEGRALVFRDYNEMAALVDRDDLDVTPDTVLVLQNAGPVGGPGMPEWGMLPIPRKLLKQGVRDMLRVSDARMSGTSYGACVLHVSPESHIGGPFAAVRTGDVIAVDVAGRRIDVRLSAAEIAARLAEHQPPPRDYPRGYARLFARHIGQAHEGCDFDFLAGAGGVPEPEIH